MIPNHVLNDLKAGERVTILAKGNELRFVVHPASEPPETIRDTARRDGMEVVASHLKDKDEILRFVAARERDVGGEG